MLPNKPKITDAEVDKVVNFFFPSKVPDLLLVAVRGYFKNTVGKKGENDINKWDDAMLVYENGTLIKTFNANTDPSKQDLAMLDPGVYQFARGKHKGRIDAFRASPEGVRLPCTRNGKKSWCSFINIHDGGRNDTWSAGCITLPNWATEFQFNTFRNLVYNRMIAMSLPTVTMLLITEDEMQEALAGE